MNEFTKFDHWFSTKTKMRNLKQPLIIDTKEEY